jgi:hypothetical protein
MAARPSICRRSKTMFSARNGGSCAAISREVNVALEQGEVQGTCGMGWSSIQLQNPDWVTNGKFRLIAQEATKGQAQLTAMNVPLTYGFATTDADRAVMQLAYSQELFGRPFVLPPGAPPERVAAMRKAFMAAMHDPELLADAKKQRLEINPIAGEEVQALVAKVYTMPPEVIARAKDALVYKGAVKPRTARSRAAAGSPARRRGGSSAISRPRRAGRS